jgi:O-antigen ligase
MFITGGRAGQVMFFAMLGILFIQLLLSKKYKLVLFVIILIPGIFYFAYLFSDIFHSRVHETINSIVTYSPQSADALGHRVTFAINTWGVITNNILIGVGTGDFPDAYANFNKLASPSVPNTSNPHNMYLLVQAQLGIFGLLSLLSIFYYQIKLSFSSSDKFIRDVGITLPLLFLLAMFSDSYLLGHYTSLVFVFFSSFLYKDFEKS